MRVFLSYRRDDAGGHAGRLSDALSERLGAGSVFHDVTAIGPGLNFDHEIDRALDECDAVLALIGPAWLDAASSDGSRRLFASDDYVRRELARALTRDVPLVPVLVGGARLPSEEELPDSIAALSQRQQVILHDESWHNDVNGLVRSLRREPLRPRRRRWPTLLGIVLATIVVVGAVLWFVRRDASSLGPCEPPGDGWTQLEPADNPGGSLDVEDGQLTFDVDAAWSRPIDTTRWTVVVDSEMTNDTPFDQEHDQFRYGDLVVGRQPSEATCFSADPDVIESGLKSAASIGFTVQCEPDGYIYLELDEGADRIDVTNGDEPEEC